MYKINFFQNFGSFISNDQKSFLFQPFSEKEKKYDCKEYNCNIQLILIKFEKSELKPFAKTINNLKKAEIPLIFFYSFMIIHR